MSTETIAAGKNKTGAYEYPAANEITIAKFNELIAAGAVFLPAAGVHYADGKFGYEGRNGAYFFRDDVRQFLFTPLGVFSDNFISADDYKSIRLVRSVN